MAHASLTGLPDHLLLDIVEYFDTARDVSHLGRVTKYAHKLVEQAGWKAFVKTRFPALTVPVKDGLSWSSATERFTYLDRCWDKRAIQFGLFKTQPPPRQRGRGRIPSRQAVDFHGVVDALHVPSLDQEVVAWGAGEDLQVRWGTAEGTKSNQKWGSILGRDGNYSAGIGDVTTLKIIERTAGAALEIVVGRANGDVELLSAADDDSFGMRTRNLLKLDERENADQMSALSISPGRLAVNCTEWQPDREVLATCRSSYLHLYSISSGNDEDLKPLAFYDMSKNRPPNEESFVRDVKFLGKDHLAVALGGSSQPIQYGTIRPTGIVFEHAVHNPNVRARIEGKLEPALTDVNTIVWAIQPVGHRNDKNLLLSSWQDGTFRLLDARTPSPHDAIYRDNFQPYQAGGPLLVYGTDRFVTGNNTAPTVRLFDFRSPKPYYHSTALSCSPAQPRPRACCSSDSLLPDKSGFMPECRPGIAKGCNWHTLSRSDCYRQDATFWLAYRGMDRVFSLAKASDTSDRFYLGLRGAISEAQLVLKEDIPQRQPKQQSCPDGWQFSKVRSVTMAETGVGLCSSSVHDGLHGELHRGMPELFYNKKMSGKTDDGYVFAEPPERSRLDATLRQQTSVRDRGGFRRR
ncbi:hypothetical protein QQS21_011541 [Conoideocrella luteorostrata]|uniref:F-box domain-containing protein n=1 Tax=Conoideocrella luteorostrata TaxID=1105319 RepID=A0AAJ0FNA3_9HYPO|nr:hypothetical protein QQS21_011541 [Conoideocrella luteorostrata]